MEHLLHTVYISGNGFQLPRVYSPYLCQQHIGILFIHSLTIHNYGTIFIGKDLRIFKVDHFYMNIFKWV